MYHPRGVLTNQPHGRGAGRGVAGRSGHGNSGGAGGDPGRNTTTPTGRFNSGRTKFKVGQAVMLLTECGRDFPVGTIVVIRDIEEAPQSATKRPGQDAPWSQSDHDSLYRFHKEYLKDKTDTITSWSYGKGMVRHYDLSPAPRQPHAPEQYLLPSLVYTNQAVKFPCPGSNRLEDSITAPAGLLCFAAAHASQSGNGPNGKPNGKVLIVKTNIHKCFYIVQAKCLTYTQAFDICSRKKEVFNFRALTAEELDEYGRSLIPPAPQVIDWR